MIRLFLTLISTLTFLSYPAAAAENVTYSDFAAMQNDIESLNNTVNEQQALVSKLSDDIGIMADRIGEMANRIVGTEELLAQTLTVLLNNPDFVGTSSSNGTALTSPVDGETLGATAPVITTIPASTVYLLYVSAEPTFSNGSTMSLYVDSSTALSSKWSQVRDFTGSADFYLAVKRIDGSTISTISNGVKVSF